MEHRFQIDLRGIVGLLSHDLYASPRVHRRELLPNAVDAITARGLPDGRVDPGAGRGPAKHRGPVRAGAPRPGLHRRIR